MARSQTMVQLTDELVAELDTEAQRRGISRSAIIREALDAYLAQQRSDDIGRRIVAGYVAKPPTTPDEWASVGHLGDTGSAELGQRLDEEERTAGHAPW
jgi:hypothetical protein